jgi:hypothetical protein
LLGAAFSLEVRHHARGFAAGRQIVRERAGKSPIEIRKQCAARVAGDDRYLIADRPEAEPVEPKSCRFLSASGHKEKSSREAGLASDQLAFLLWQKFYFGRPNRTLFPYGLFMRSGVCNAASPGLAAQHAAS